MMNRCARTIVVGFALLSAGCALLGADPAACKGDAFCPWGEVCVLGVCQQSLDTQPVCATLEARLQPGETGGPVLENVSMQSGTGGVCASGLVIINVDVVDAEGDFFTQQADLTAAIGSIEVVTATAAGTITETAATAAALDGNSGSTANVGVTVCRDEEPAAVALQMPDGSGHRSAPACAATP